MKCPNCRNEISNNTLRCPYCNYLIADSRAAGNYTTPVYTNSEGADPRYSAQHGYYTHNDAKMYMPSYNEYAQEGYYAHCYPQKQKNSETTTDWGSILLALGVLNIGLQIILLVLTTVILFRL